MGHVHLQSVVLTANEDLDLVIADYKSTQTAPHRWRKKGRAPLEPVPAFLLPRSRLLHSMKTELRCIFSYISAEILTHSKKIALLNVFLLLIGPF